MSTAGKTEAEITATDKITGKSESIVLITGQTVKYGEMEITVRNCFSRAVAGSAFPEYAAFVGVNDIVVGAGIFNGWMFSSSPSLSVVEHPFYDIELVKCVDKKEENEDE